MKRQRPHRSVDPLLTGPLRGHWRTYLVPALGGAAVTSVYSIVDTIAIGYGVGPAGAAAAAVLVPSFGLMAFLGTLLGMGGAILLATARGRGDRREGDAWFTLSFLLCLIVGVIVAASVLLAGDSFWRLCGADDTIVQLADEYGFWVVLTWPGAMLSLAMACLIRNDGAPGYALMAIIAGGVLNIFGDWLLVFPFKIGTGMAGAGIATAAGCALQTILLVAYLFKRRCTLRFAPPSLWPRRAIRRLCAVGLAPGLPNAAVAVVVTLANHQAMRHGGVAALSILGIMLSLSSLYQQLFNGVAQALQPIVSVNYGAGGRARIRRSFWLGARMAFALGLACSLVSLIFPVGTLRFFMNPTPEVIALAPTLVRGIASSFLPMALCILAAGYLQALLRTLPAATIALLRSVGLSAMLLLCLPPFLGLDGLWLALTATEWITLILALVALLRLWGREIPQESAPLA